ncbi:MAG: virulence RhuM family protein, partial [Armatimonadota bacterium]|nr:virulence RhuM family protein [Armatimonadota bacterium]
LEEAAVVKDYLTTAADGKGYRVSYYNLDVIISVGYRVRSHVGTQFRIWATQRLRDYIVKGFALDVQRLKEQATIGDYFDELLEQIRDIRSSEKLLYKRVREICALSIDYVSGSEHSQVFFATVQNKLHFAVTGMTAAEIVKSRANARQPNMGLTAFSGEVVRKKDVTVAKNYLGKDEIETLNLLVSQFLDFAELQAKQQREVRMADWLSKLDEILRLNGFDVLSDLGRVSARVSEEHAHAEYLAFQEVRQELKRRELEAEPDVVAELEGELKSLEGKRKKRKKD